MSQKKQIFKLSILKNFLNDANSCVSLVPSMRLLALPPFFLNDMKSGIFYLLNSLLKKYDRSLDGIVMGYQNVKILMDENTGIIPIGSAETEVNVSVEFYIFQPKIGNTLEGVINKKSNNHIGCLVHQYFNATILKPEDVEYEDWNCKCFDVNDKIIFKVKDLDFTGLLPYIEGVVSNEDLLACGRYKTMDGCDLDVPNHDRKRKAEEFDEATASKKFKKEQRQINGTVEFVDELLRQELNKVKKELNMSEEKKEKKTKDNESLYEKLMKDVKNEITAKNNKEVDSESSSKKKKKKKKHKEKEKFRNGSMYDIEITPEKANVEKNFFSDSEKSHQSSAKKKNVNGVASTKKCPIQTLLDQFYEEEGKKLKSDSDKESLKESRKQKKDKKPKLPANEKEESLYEKLLREARNRIEVREDSPPKKRRKTK